MMEKVESKDIEPQFKRDVAACAGGENVKLCFACGTCTAGCPVAGVDDEFDPRKIIRQILLGLRKEVLSSAVIWRCVQCYSCSFKCPQNVRFRDVIRALRGMAVAEGFADESLLAEIEKVDVFSQDVRRKLVKTLVDDRKKFAKDVARIEEIVND